MPLAQQLGRYRLLDRIAFGGMAEIFRAKTFDAEGRVHLVAVKRVLNHLCADDEFLRMLADEARLSATLEHENIARVYEFAVADGPNGDEYFIAMEYVDGKDVRSLIERQRALQEPLAPEHAAWIGMEVAHALHAAHTQKDAAGRPLHIVHRDVSPSNVLCSYRGEIKLCDFGIAKAATTRVQTKTGVIKGKVKYMSPEQAMGRKLDHRSDLFSLGTVLYEMLTLAAPFAAATEVELIFAVRDARKRPLRTLTPSVPPELEQLVDRLMERGRAERFQSGAEVALALRLFLDRYHPGYRRSHFGRFMRAAFAADIERELRLLEEYVVDGGDPSKVGENLIADALADDAPYTQFTASAGAPSAASETPAPGLHAEQTRILDRRAPGDLHALQTQILARADGRRHERDAEPRALPELHALETRILARPPDEEDAVTPLHAEKTRILPRSQLGSLADDVDSRTPTSPGDEPSTLERRPDGGPAAEERALDEETVDQSPRRRRDTEPADLDGAVEEPTAVPLGDDDDDR